MKWNGRRESNPRERYIVVMSGRIHCPPLPPLIRLMTLSDLPDGRFEFCGWNGLAAGKCGIVGRVTEKPGQIMAVSPAADGVFATTRWSLVLAAQGDSTQAHDALEVLCRSYWFPVYALIRGRGLDKETARDLTQDFFAKLLAQDNLARVRRERVRFRSFLAQSVKNFLADEWDKTHALKRGGGHAILSLDFETAEGRYHEPADHASPDREFDRRWAAQILAEARQRFEQESRAAGREEIIRVLNQLGEPDAPSGF